MLVKIDWEWFRKKENEEGMSNMQKTDGCGGLKSETPIEMETVAIETMERTVGDLRRDHKKGQNWISMR
jgi:hypothetical protein